MRHGRIRYICLIADLIGVDRRHRIHQRMPALVIARAAKRILLIHADVWQVVLLWVLRKHGVLAATALMRPVHLCVVLWRLLVLLLRMEQVGYHVASWSIELVQLYLYVAILDIADCCLALLALAVELARRVRLLLSLPLGSPLVLPRVEEDAAQIDRRSLFLVILVESVVAWCARVILVRQLRGLVMVCVQVGSVLAPSTR